MSNDRRVSIVRKADGICAVPSPQVVPKNGHLTVQNFTDCSLAGDFKTVNGKPTFKLGPCTDSENPPRAQVLVSGPSGYHQYQVTATCGITTVNVQGGSDPEIIIDP